MILALILVLVFALVATTDSMYFHIWKYRLHERAESQYEHLLHTANVVVFVPQIYLFVCVVPSGGWLWLAVLLSLCTLAIEIADVLCENDSRRSLGGLVPAEYLMHFLMSGLRMGFVFAVLATHPLSDFLAPASLGEAPWYAQLLGWCMVLPGTVVASLHVVLVFSGRRALAARTQDTRPAQSAALG